MRGLALLVSALGFVATANALEPLPVKHVESVRVSVANRAQKALALHATASGGWRLDLEGDGVSADVIDVTPGTPARTLTIAVVVNTLKFERGQFAGGHVYRVQLNGGKRPAVSLVYLYPDAAPAKMPAPGNKKAAGPQRVRFDGNEPATKDEGISRVEKGSL
ncbi:MAG TPA: hypothetical protein VGL86_09775 [Polyangia bacterium]|jgi:hypothetical protein